LKILLVDDSGLSRKVQARVLRELGAEEVIEAKDGLDALRKLEELGFDVGLVLTDWNMPAMDGVALIRRLRESPEGRDLPIIVVSSEYEEERIGQALASGADSYVTKPFKKEVLARKIESVRAVAGLKSEGDGPEAVALEGDLERLGFAELVGFLNFSKKSGELVITLETGEAGVSFADGEVRDAWIGRFASEDAFKALARLQGGRFRFLEDRPPRSARIERPTMSLLMEAMRLVDEEAAGG